MQIKQSVIAHRGASGYLPEHCIEAKAMAYAMGADFIEQDVVMSKDDQLVVLHDHYLDNISDVAQCFPERARKDKHYYVIDFTLEEIQSLTMSELFDIDYQGHKTAHYPERFPLHTGHFKVHTLQQEIELIQGLNKSTGKNVGLYVEIKSPFFHLEHGKDLSLSVLSVLKEYGYHSREDNIYLQSFDKHCLEHIKYTLFPALNMEVKLVQLIAETEWLETPYRKGDEIANYDYEWMYQPEAMKKVALYADVIAPWYPRLLTEIQQAPYYKINTFTADAQQLGLQVHPYTFRREKQTLPAYIKDFEHLLTLFLDQIKVDAVFTDFPDIVVHFLQKKLSGG